MKLLFTLVPESVAGGVYVTEKAFLDALALRPGIIVQTVRYGKRKDGESIIEKLSGRAVDLWHFSRLLSRERPDVVHLNSALDPKAIVRDVPFVLLMSIRRVRLFLKWHGTDARIIRSGSVLWRSMISFLISRATTIGVLSSEERQNLAEAGFDVRNVFVVKNCVPVRPDVPVRDSRHSSFPRLLFVGRVIRSKGVFELLELARRLSLSQTPYDVTIVGSGADLDACRDLVRRNGLEDRVRMTGQVTEAQAWQYYTSSDILVFPTFHDEGFPMTVLHSVAAGLAIVTTRIRAAADHLQEPGNCLWVKAQDPNDLEEKVRSLITRPEVCEAMGQRNRELATHFRPDAVVDELMPLYTWGGQP